MINPLSTPRTMINSAVFRRIGAFRAELISATRLLGELIIAMGRFEELIIVGGRSSPRSTADDDQDRGGAGPAMIKSAGGCQTMINSAGVWQTMIKSVCVGIIARIVAD